MFVLQWRAFSNLLNRLRRFSGRTNGQKKSADGHQKAGNSGSQCLRVFDKSTKAGGMKAALPSTQSFTSVTSVSGSRYYIESAEAFGEKL